MKQKNLIIVVMVIAAISLNSCRKNPINESTKNKNYSSDYAMPPDGTTAQEIQNQLNWIARALPEMVKNDANFYSDLHTFITSTAANAKYNINSQNQLITSSGYDFNLTTYSKVNTLFSNNNYDSAYFYGFHLEDCFYKTFIQIPDPELVPNYNVKPFLACAVFETNQNQLMGYYINTNTNALDSILVDMENAEDYYIWVVTADNMCLEEASTPIGPHFDDADESSCGNGDCEGFLGETPANCADCHGANGPQTGKYTLVFQDMQHLSDNYFRNPTDNATGHENRFHESYFSGKYDIVYQFAVVDVSNGNSQFIKDAWYINNINVSSRRDRYTSNNGQVTKKWKNILLARLKINRSSPDVVRCKSRYSGSIQCNSSNPAPVFPINKTLSYNFDPENDRIITDMYELDRIHTPATHQYSAPGFSIDMKFRYGSGNPKKKHYFAGVTNETLNSIAPNWIDGTSLYGAGSLYIDLIMNDPTSQTEISDIYVGFTQSEMRVRYVLYPNP